MTWSNATRGSGTLIPRRTPLTRLALLGTVLLLGLVVAVPPVFASHTQATGHVYVSRGGQDLAHYFETTSCTGTPCIITLDLPTKDYNRFVRWCPANPTYVEVTSPNTVGQYICAGPGPWQIFLQGVLDAHSEGSSIFVQINVSKA